MNGEEKTLSTYMNMGESAGGASAFMTNTNGVGVIVSMAAHALFIAIFLLLPAATIAPVKTFHISFSEGGSAPAADILKKHGVFAPPERAHAATTQRPTAAPVVVKKTATRPAFPEKTAAIPPATAAPETKPVETSPPRLEDALPASPGDAFIAATETRPQTSLPVAGTAVSPTAPTTAGKGTALSSGIAVGGGTRGAAGNGAGNASGNGTTGDAGSAAPMETRFGETNAPRFIHRAMPVYPPLARRRGKEGRVVLTLLIDKTGKVEAIDVTEPAGFGLTEAAIEAVRKSTFAPAHVGGRKVASRAVLPIRFQLE